MAHPDMDALLDEGLQTAIHFLEKNGEFVTVHTPGNSDGAGCLATRASTAFVT